MVSTRIKMGAWSECACDHCRTCSRQLVKGWQVLANAERVLAIELLAAVQGVEFLAPLQPGAGVRTAREFVRSLSPRLRDDRQLSGDIEAVAEAVRDGLLMEAVEAELGELQWVLPTVAIRLVRARSGPTATARSCMARSR